MATVPGAIQSLPPPSVDRIGGLNAPRLRSRPLALLAAFWSGPFDLSPSLRLEWRFVLVRWVGILVCAPLVLLPGFTTGSRLAAYAVILCACFYNFAVQRAIARRAAITYIGVLTTVGDAALNFGMFLLVGGGFNSPFVFCLFVLIVSVAMRFGYAAAIAEALVFISVNAILDITYGQPLDATFFFRSFFLCLTALLAGFLVEQVGRDQAALRASHDALSEAYANLAAAHEELVQIDELKSNFIANVSHELRTPLTSVLAYSELLLTYEEQSSPEQKEFLEIIHTESARLTRLLNDVLDLAKIESGDMRLSVEPVDIEDLVNAATRAHRGVVEQQGLRLEIDVEPDLPFVRGDHDRLRQVLANLLSNATKFTKKGTIRVGATRVGAEVHIWVADTGVGIPADHVGRVFDKFHQVGDLMTDKPTGTGLGLAICRELVESHGGRIWAESELGTGSTFTVALPAPIEEPTRPVVAPATGSAV
jgi:signal transduction histidine kinase